MTFLIFWAGFSNLDLSSNEVHWLGLHLCGPSKSAESRRLSNLSSVIDINEDHWECFDFNCASDCSRSWEIWCYKLSKNTMSKICTRYSNGLLMKDLNKFKANRERNGLFGNEGRLPLATATNSIRHYTMNICRRRSNCISYVLALFTHSGYCGAALYSRWYTLL